MNTHITLKRTFIILSWFSLIGCIKDSNTTETVKLEGCSIASGVLTNASSNSSVTVDGENRIVTLTPTTGSPGSYYLPYGTALASNTAASFYTINQGSTLFTGTIEGQNSRLVQISKARDIDMPPVGWNTVYDSKTDAGLFNQDFKIAHNIALLPGSYILSIPKVVINGSLRVDKFIIANIIVDNAGASNFIKNITNESVLPLVGSPVAVGKIGLQLDTLGYNKDVDLTIEEGDISYTVSGRTDSTGNVLLDFARKEGTLSNIKCMTLSLNSYDF